MIKREVWEFVSVSAVFWGLVFDVTMWVIVGIIMMIILEAKPLRYYK